MSSRYRPRLALHAAVAALSTLAAQASAQNSPTLTRTFPTPYTATGIDAWQAVTSGDLGPFFLGVNVPAGTYGSPNPIPDLIIPGIDLGLFTIPPTNLGKTGANVTLGGPINVGLSVKSHYTAGQFDFNYNAQAVLGYPQYVSPGDTVTITLGTAVDPITSTLRTHRPTFTVGMKAVAQINTDFSTDAYLFGGHLVSPTRSSDTRFHFADVLSVGGKAVPNYKENIDVSYDLPTIDFGDANTYDPFLKVFNAALGAANPTPVSAELSIPQLDSSASDVAGTQVHSAVFGKFLGFETSLLDLMLAFIPNEDVKHALELTQGDYTVPGTNYELQWGLCKASGNVDLGLYGDYILQGYPTYGLQAKDANGNLLTVTQTKPGTFTFKMPASGAVKLNPTQSMAFHFTNWLGMAVGGSVGFYPLYGGISGDLAAGLYSVDYSFDVSKQVKTWPASKSSGFLLKQDADFDVTSRVKSNHADDPSYLTRTLPSSYLYPVNLQDLPSSIEGRDTSKDDPALPPPGPSLYNGFAYDQFGEKGVQLITVVPSTSAGSYTFLQDFYPSEASVDAYWHRPGQDDNHLYVLPQDRANNGITFRLPYAGVAPGQSSIEFTVVGYTKDHRQVSRKYTVVVQAFARKAFGAPTFYTQAGGNAGTETNRLVGDGADHALYLHDIRNVYANSEVVIDGQYVVPSDIGIDDEQQLLNGEAADVMFTVPGALGRLLGGALHKVTIRTPGVGSLADGTRTPAVSSDPIDLYFTAAAPPKLALAKATVRERADGAAPYGDKDVWLTLTGTGFTQATAATLTGPGGTFTLSDSSLAYSKPPASPTDPVLPDQMRVHLTPDVLAAYSKVGAASGTITVTTPYRRVPTASNALPAMDSGGTSNPVTVNFAYPTPSVSSIVPGRLTRGGAPATLRVYGDNLFNATTGNPKATTFTLGGQPLAVKAYDPAATGIVSSYVDLTLPSDLVLKAGPLNLVASNAGVSQKPFLVSVTNGQAQLNTLGRTRVRVGPTYAYTVPLTGAPLYPDTAVSFSAFAPADAAAGKVGFAFASNQELDLSLDYATLNAVSGTKGYVMATNPTPGGGASGSLPLTLEEGDPSTVKVVPGALVFDRASGDYKQSFALTYIGTRDVSRGVQLTFPNLTGTGWTVTNQTNLDVNAKPFINVSVVPRRQVTVVAVFHNILPSLNRRLDSTATIGFAD